MEPQTDQEITRAVESLGIHGSAFIASDQKVAVKYLLSNAAAGVIIGRGGGNREEFQSKSGAHIQLSASNQFYPGTTDRVLLLSGTVKSVLTALYHILIKLHNGDESAPDSCKSITAQVKVVMPAVVCGSIIGKGGVTIRSFSQDSGTNISMSPQDPGRGVDYERIITIAGGLEQLLRAVALVVTKVAENPNYVNNTSLDVAAAAAKAPSGLHSPVPHPAPFVPRMMPSTPPPMGPMYPGLVPVLQHPAMMPHHHHQAAAAAAAASAAAAAAAAAAAQAGGQRVEICMHVPDSAVGMVIGKGGEHVIGLKRLLGVKIQVASKDPAPEGQAHGHHGQGQGRQVRSARSSSSSSSSSSMALRCETATHPPCRQAGLL
jgi:RNA-binding protein Nova